MRGGIALRLSFGGLAFPGDAALAADAKRGVLSGSPLSGIGGYPMLRLAGEG